MTTEQALDIIDTKRIENDDTIEAISLEEAGLEELDPNDTAFKSGIIAYLDWFYDGEMSEFDQY